MNIPTKAATPKPASAVTTRWNVRVGRTQTSPITARTTSEPRKPGVPVIPPVESVNHVFALSKK